MVLAKPSRGLTLNRLMLTIQGSLECFLYSLISFAIFMTVSWNLPAFFFSRRRFCNCAFAVNICQLVGVKTNSDVVGSCHRWCELNSVHGNFFVGTHWTPEKIYIAHNCFSLLKLPKHIGRLNFTLNKILFLRSSISVLYGTKRTIALVNLLDMLHINIQVL